MKIANYFKKYLYLIGILLFVFIISRLDFGYYKTLTEKIHFSGFLIILTAIIFLFLPLLTLNSFRWQKLMRAQGIKYSFKDSFLMYEASVYIGLLTPGRIGEAARVLYLKKEHSLGRAFVSVVLDRLADIVFLLLFGYFAMFFFFNILKKEILALGIIFFFLLVLMFLILRSSLLKYFFQKAFHYFTPPRYRDSWRLNLGDFFRDFKIYKFKDYIFAFFVTVINWLVYYFIIYLFARQIGLVQIPLLYFFSALAAVSLVAILPISVLGLGTRDAVLLLMFSIFGVPAELTIAVSMFILFLNFVTALIGLFCWIKKPILL